MMFFKMYFNEKTIFVGTANEECYFCCFDPLWVNILQQENKFEGINI